jgi:hypothetical protein
MTMRAPVPHLGKTRTSEITAIPVDLLPLTRLPELLVRLSLSPLDLFVAFAASTLSVFAASTLSIVSLLTQTTPQIPIMALLWLFALLASLAMATSRPTHLPTTLGCSILLQGLFLLARFTHIYSFPPS